LKHVSTTILLVRVGLTAACSLCFGGTWTPPASAADHSAAIHLKTKRGEAVLETLAGSLEHAAGPAAAALRLQEINEIRASLANLREPPVAPTYDFFEVPIAFAARLRSGIGQGSSEATNLRDPASADASKRDPLPSSYWSRPVAIATRNLKFGYARSSAATFEQTVWSYRGPKIGTGLNPGFHAKSGGVKIRIKFAEIKSEPFTARIFWALGYNVDPTFHSRGIKFRYDRRFFEEFNSRDEVSTQFRFAVLLPIYRLKMQRQHDPFEFIATAVMQDGRRFTGRELKRFLLSAEGPEGSGLRFRPEVEASIDHLITVPANIQIREAGAESIGPWQFAGLGHEDLRELRGAGLLAAWVGWNDCRIQNTRLRVLQQSGSPRLLHYFTDLGGGLGKADGIFSGKGELPNEFGWTFTKPPEEQGRGRMTIPFRITGYRPMERNKAFEKMTMADARWMARLIGQLTAEQIRSALAGSGFEGWELELYHRKLIHRRDRMIIDLGLAAEVNLLAPSVAGREGAKIRQVPALWSNSGSAQR
jgi:hypothetical protein